jgi:hypothetical protein
MDSRRGRFNGMRFQPGFRYGASVPFVGLLDTYTGALAAYSFRKLRTAYAGSAVRIRESGGNTEADIGFTSGGDFNAAAAASHIGGNSGFIVTWYDQSGNGDDLTQSTSTQQPLYVASGIGSKPCLDFVDTSVTQLTSGTDAIALNSTTASCFAVAIMETGTDAYGRLVTFKANGATLDYDNTASASIISRFDTNNVIEAYRNGNKGSANASLATAYSIASIFDAANHNIYLNGTVGTGVASSGTLGGASGGTFRVGGQLGTSDGSSWDGNCSEVILYASDQTANVAGIDADYSSYYGV